MDTSIYQVIDGRTGEVVSTHATAKAARRSAERRDLAYGACRFWVTEVTA
jgi:hypothetical protein